MTAEILALLMFVFFFILLVVGYPVAFSFAATGVVFGIIGVLIGAFDFGLVRFLFSRWFGALQNFTLLAIPFFVFMGAMLEKSGLAERLLTTVGMLMGPLRGGLGLTVIVVGTLMAAATGVVAATVIVMGILSLPVMIRYGYDHKLAAGLIGASGTLAQIIPPSLVLIVISAFIPVSVGDLFAGALIPGLMMAGLYMIYTVIIAYARPHTAPPLPPEYRTVHGWALAREAFVSVLPPIVLIFAVLGSIFFGIATPSEAGAVGAVGATLMAIAYRSLDFKVLRNAARSTTDITALVLQILFGSTFFGLVFKGLGGDKLITGWLLHVPGGVWGFLLIANLVVFFLGMLLEFIEIAFIVLPLFVPAVQALGIDLAWFAVLMGINLNIAFMSPPVGFTLFYLQSVAPPEIKTREIHLGAFPFMGLQLIVLILVMVFPGTVTWTICKFFPGRCAIIG